MGLICFLASFFLTATTSSFAGHQEAEQGLNHSALHLTLYHVHGHGSPLTSHSPPSLSELVSQDQARVKHLNSRLTKNRTSSSVTNSTSHKSEHLVGPKFITTPLEEVAPNMGNYYVTVGIGTPPKDYPVIVDTGSSFCWLQCQPCRHCPTYVNFFNPSASSTYKKLACATSECNLLEEATNHTPNCTSPNECKYTATYVDKSFSIGYLSQDSLTLTHSEILPGFVYGCGQDHEKRFEFFGQSTGLFGLARNSKLSMISQLSANYGHDFSYCLPTASGGGVGSLSIGRDSLTGPSYKFTPMLTSDRDSSLYCLRLSAIAVAGTTLRVAQDDYSTSTVIDSGTVITRLPARVYEVLRDEFNKTMSSKYRTVGPYSDLLDTCYEGSLKEMSDVPEIRLVFQGGAELTLAPRNVLVDGDKKGTVCLAFADNSDTTEYAIIGNIQLQTYSVAYDVSNSRIGFAPGGCT